MDEHASTPFNEVSKTPTSDATVRRSRNGCTSCRRRKVRCDEERPDCRACRRLGLGCEYDCTTSRRATRSKRRFQVRFVEGIEGTLQPPSQDVSHSNISSTRHESHETLEINERQQPQIEAQSVNDAAGPATPTFDISMNGLDSFINQQSSPGTSQLAWFGGMEDMFDVFGIPIDQPSWDSGFSFPQETASTSENIDIPPLEPQVSHESTTPGNIDQDVAESADSPWSEPVHILPEDHEPLQHYLGTMVKFSKLRNSTDDNLYSSIFTDMGLSYLPLFKAMMAWSSLHLSQTRKLPTDDAERRADEAFSLLCQHDRALDLPKPTLVTVWLLLQFELLYAERIDRFSRLLGFAAETIAHSTQNHDSDSLATALGPLGTRVLVMLSSYDARAAFLGEGGRILGYLKLYPSVYEVIGRYAAESDKSRPAMISSDQISSRQNVQSPLLLALRLKLKILTGQILLLAHRTVADFEDQTVFYSSWETVRENMKKIRDEIEDDRSNQMEEAKNISLGNEPHGSQDSSAETYNRLMLLATYYAAVLFYVKFSPSATGQPHQSLAQTPRRVSFDDSLSPSSPSECAQRILHLSHRASVIRAGTPQAIWPMLLFHAGCETRDPIYRTWAIEQLRTAEVWGRNIEKTRILLEHITRQRMTSRISREVQSQGPPSLEILSAMDQKTGRFIL